MNSLKWKPSPQLSPSTSYLSEAEGILDLLRDTYYCCNLGVTLSCLYYQRGMRFWDLQSRGLLYLHYFYFLLLVKKTRRCVPALNSRCLWAAEGYCITLQVIRQKCKLLVKYIVFKKSVKNQIYYKLRTGLLDYKRPQKMPSLLFCS